MTVKELKEIYTMIYDKVEEIIEFTAINNKDDANIEELVVLTLVSNYGLKLIDKKIQIATILEKYNRLSSDIISDEDIDNLNILEINKITEELYGKINSLKG